MSAQFFYTVTEKSEKFWQIAIKTPDLFSLQDLINKPGEKKFNEAS